MTDPVTVDNPFFQDLHRDHPWLKYELKLAKKACHVKCYWRYDTDHLTKESRKLLKNYLAYRTGAAF